MLMHDLWWSSDRLVVCLIAQRGFSLCFFVFYVKQFSWSMSIADMWIHLSKLISKKWGLTLHCRDIGKDKDKCDGGEDEEGKEHNTPRGRKTANSQGRRKGRITTRSMAIEAASVAADEAPPNATDPSLPDPPQLAKSDPAQKAIKEPAKPQTPIASVDANKGICLAKRGSSSSPSFTLLMHNVIIREVPPPHPLRLYVSLSTHSCHSFWGVWQKLRFSGIVP